jgi:hypothetical protein
MLWILGATLFAGGIPSLVAKPAASSGDVTLYGPSFPVGNLTFTIPSKWKIEMVESPARGGQWRVPPLHADGDGGEVVVFFFGPGLGGSPKENVEAYNQAVSLPGIPPQPKANYGLLGAVIENAKGNIYWRFTGPEALITANLPLFNKVIDSVKPQERTR